MPPRPKSPPSSGEHPLPAQETRRTSPVVVLFAAAVALLMLLVLLVPQGDEEDTGARRRARVDVASAQRLVEQTEQALNALEAPREERQRFRLPQVEGPAGKSSRITAEEEPAGDFPPTEDYVTSSTLELAGQELPGEVIGWVSDPRGSAIAGATVTLRFEEGEQPGDAAGERKGNSDGSGLFRVPDVPPGRWSAVAEKQGFAKDVRTGIDVLPGQRTEPVDLRLGPELTISGKVQSGGKGVPGARVVAFREHLAVHGQERVVPIRVEYWAESSAAGGSFTLRQLPRGTVQVEVTAAGYAPLRERMDLTESRSEVLLKLEPEASIAGFVVGPRGVPVPNASVTLRLPPPEPQDKPFASVRTRADGAFRIEGLPASATFLASAKAEGFAPSAPMEVRSGTVAAVLTLGTGGAVEGTVRSFESGKPLPGMRVVAQAEKAEPPRVVQTRTNAEGRYRLENLPAGTYTVAVADDRLTADPRGGVKVGDTGAARGIDFAVYEGLALRGTVTDGTSGDALPGARVRLTGRVGQGLLVARKAEAFTDKLGAFSFPNLPQGVFNLKAELAGYMQVSEKSEGARVELLRGTPPQDVDVKLLRAGSIEGIVLDAARNAVAGALVQLFHEGSTPGRIDTNAFRATTSAAGTFTLEGIPLHQEVHLRATAFSDALGKGASEVVVLNRRQTAATVTVELGGGLALRVLARTPEGEGVADAEVVLTHGSFQDPAPGAWTQRTGRDGTVVFPNIPPGTVYVSGQKAGFLHATASARLAPGEPARVELEMPRGRVLAGRVVDDMDEPLRAGEVRAWPEANTRGYGVVPLKDDSTFRIDTLGAGRFRVEAAVRRPTASGERSADWSIPGIPPNDGNGEVVLKIPLSGALLGTVQWDADSEKPVPYTAVLAGTYTDDAGIGRTLNATARFEVGKDFLFEALPPGQYLVTIKAPGFLPQLAGPFTVRRLETTDAGTVSLRDGGKVRLRVVRRGTGEPIPGAMAHLTPEWQTARANGKGEVLLNPVKPGLYSLALRDADHLPLDETNIKVRRGDTTDLGVMQMEPGAVLYGTVLNGDGAPIEKAIVEARGVNQELTKTTLTDSGGRYRLTGLVPGGQVVTAQARVRKFDLSQSAELQLSTEEETELDFTLSADLRLRGRLIAPGGVDISRAVVKLYPLRANNVPNLSAVIPVPLVDAAGFVAEELVEGNYLVAIQAPRGRGQLFWSGVAQVSPSSQDATFSAGTLRLNGTLRRGPGGAAIRNQDVRLDLISEPQSGVAALRRWWQWSTRTNAQGRFSFDFLPKGTYSLVAHNEELGADILEILTLGGDVPVTEKNFDFGVGPAPRRFSVQ